MSNTIDFTVQLSATRFNGKPAFQFRDGSYLVEKDPTSGEWQPVDRVDAPVDGKTLVASFGTWTDREITKGHLWWKKVVRPLDGKAEPDEVTTFQQMTQNAEPFAADDKGLDWAVLNDAKLQPSPLGNGLNLSEQWLVVQHQPPVHPL